MGMRDEELEVGARWRDDLLTPATDYFNVSGGSKPLEVLQF